VRRCDDVEWVELDGEIVVYDRAGEHLHRLNATAASVWRACDGRSLADVVASARGVYAGDTDVITREVRAIIDEFVDAGLVVERD
jgi:coenzyme PQQ synthesis protein D (PqqD)